MPVNDEASEFVCDFKLQCIKRKIPKKEKYLMWKCYVIVGKINNDKNIPRFCA
jgi:hypothetical protein